MKLHAYLEQLIGNKTTISLVRALLNHRRKIFTVRSLAETAQVSASEASLVVKQLEEAGVVKIQLVGRSFLVTLNEESFVLQRIIKPVIDAERETIGELIKLLRRSFSSQKSVISVYLFGSVARREEKKDSDIDILVVSNDFEKASAAVARAQEEVSLVFNKSLSPLIFSESETSQKRREKSDLLESIVGDGRFVMGKDVLATQQKEDRET